MRHVSFSLLALLLHLPVARAERLELDLPAALERAHRLAPDAVAARGLLPVAQAAVAAAAVRFSNNPVFEAGAGPRLSGSRTTDLELRVEQELDPWRRGPRRRVAQAGVAQAAADGAVALRALDLAVAIAFYDALHAERAGELARRAETLARDAVATAERRRKAGDLTELELQLARAALGRARATVHAAGSTRAVAIGELAAAIGAAAGDAIILRGDLRAAPPGDLAALRPALETRADLRALDAERAVAAAERDQARASARPELGLWASFRREDDASLVTAGVRFTLPLWNRARGEQRAATARADRAGVTRDAVLRTADRQLADALAALAAALAAVDAFERDVAPVLDDAERLLQQSLDAGQLAIPAYLAARQEILTSRRDHLDRELDAAKAAARVRFVSGGAP
jgi:outer membrane protein, heavy metal efflux system